VQKQQSACKAKSKYEVSPDDSVVGTPALEHLKGQFTSVHANFGRSWANFHVPAAGMRCPRGESIQSRIDMSEESDMKTHVKWAGLCLLMVAAGALAGPPAASEANSNVAREVVSYSDLDLQHPPGAERLYQRIAAAAERVCPGVFDRALESSMRQRSCKEKAIRHAIASIGSPELTRIYISKIAKTHASLAIAQK
jgi:UrcA family protein